MEKKHFLTSLEERSKPHNCLSRRALFIFECVCSVETAAHLPPISRTHTVHIYMHTQAKSVFLHVFSSFLGGTRFVFFFFFLLSPLQRFSIMSKKGDKVRRERERGRKEGESTTFDNIFLCGKTIVKETLLDL